MSSTFSSLLANGADYPPPKMTMLPTRRGIVEYGQRPPIENVAAQIELGLARNALALIARSELKPASTVWLPAYHCPSMVEPFLFAGCNINYYSMNSDLTPRLEDIPVASGQTAACVLVRYFGDDCAIEDSVTELQTAGYLVIEDLAHAAHTRQLHGDYGVTSLRKFYPVDSGTELLVSTRITNTERIQEAARQWVDTSTQWQLHRLQSRVKERLSRGKNKKFRYLNEGLLGQPIDGKDIEELSRHDHNSIGAKRRENYDTLSRFLSNLPLGKPLFENLCHDVIPYVFPFILDHADSFHSLKKAGIPLYRWEELATTTCKIGAHFRKNLIQLPCHQDLTADDIDYIVNVCTAISERL